MQLVDLQAALGAHPQWAFLRDNIHMNNVGSAAVGAIIACQLDKTVIHAAKGIKADFRRAVLSGRMRNPIAILAAPQAAQHQPITLVGASDPALAAAVAMIERTFPWRSADRT